MRDGRIVYVGTAGREGVAGARRTRVVDLDGQMVLPGFTTRTSIRSAAASSSRRCNLNDATTAEAVFDGIRRYAAKHPTERWMIGGGLAAAGLPEAEPDPPAARRDRGRTGPSSSSRRRPFRLGQLEGARSSPASRARPPDPAERAHRARPRRAIPRARCARRRRGSCRPATSRTRPEGVRRRAAPRPRDGQSLRHHVA